MIGEPVLCHTVIARWRVMTARSGRVAPVRQRKTMLAQSPPQPKDQTWPLPARWLIFHTKAGGMLRGTKRVIWALTPSALCFNGGKGE